MHNAASPDLLQRAKRFNLSILSAPMTLSAEVENFIERMADIQHGILISRAASRCRYGSNSRLRGISSEANGSSNSSNSGAVSNAKRYRCCFSPPDRLPASDQATLQFPATTPAYQTVAGHAFRHAVAQIAAYFVMGEQAYNRCGAFRR